MIQLYDFELSGNAYKVRLFLSILGLEYEKINVKVLEGEQKTPKYLSNINPLGVVPVLRDNETLIRDSQAILVYLARREGREDWLPTEASAMAKVMQWIAVALSNLGNSSDALRRHYFGLESLQNVKLAEQRTNYILKLMDEHLSRYEWLELGRPTIADLACFPSVALIRDVKLSLEPYPHLIAWVNRIKQLSGYITMPGIWEDEAEKVVAMQR